MLKKYDALANELELQALFVVCYELETIVNFLKKNFEHLSQILFAIQALG
jgi:hypothetical protein